MPRQPQRFYLQLSIVLNLLCFCFLFLAVTDTAPALASLEGTAPGHVLNWAREELGCDAGGVEDRAQAVMGRKGWGMGCGMCEIDPALCAQLGGEGNLATAVSYAGSNNRLRRVLAKMRAGEPFSVGVIGGSVSRGHGLDAPDGDNANVYTNLNRIVFDHLDALFPAENGVVTGRNGRAEGMNSFTNGALGGTGSDYFSLCFEEHIPEDVDLVLVELAINDEVLLRNSDSYELMVRGLLDLPRQPAILNLHIFALMFAQIFNGGDLHTGVAQNYDLPILSLRNPLLSPALNNVSIIRELFHKKAAEPDPDLADTDLRHWLFVSLRHQLSWRGHKLMGDITNAYIDSQLCQMDLLEAKSRNSDMDVLYPIPDLPRKYDQTSVVPKLSPNCFTMNGEKHKLKPKASEGWREWNWEAKKYLIADQPGSTVSFAFSTQLGSVQLHYLRSAIFGLGSVFCWVDDERDSAMRIDGYWPEKYNIGRGSTIRSDLEPGEHELNCELLEATADPGGGREFRIISVMRLKSAVQLSRTASCGV